MPRIIDLLCASILALGFARPAYAQNESCQHRTVPLSAYDSEGRTINGFTPSDFEAKYRGQPVKILSVLPDDRPHRVVILLDASGSMLNLWKPALAAASDLAETRLPNTQVALIIFNEKTTEQIEFSVGPGAVAERLRQILSDANYASKSVHGRTALFDSLREGLRVLGSPTSADSLYLISDAEGDNFSHANFDNIARQLTSSRVRLFLAAVLHPPLGYRNRTPEEINGRGSVFDLVKRTGGEIIAPYRQGMPTNPKETKQVSRAMKAFYTWMTKNDRLEVELPLPVDKHGNWELKFSPEKRKQFKGAEISYPASLVPCGS